MKRKSMFLALLFEVVGLFSSVCFADGVAYGDSIGWDAVFLGPVFLVLTLIISIPIFFIMGKKEKNKENIDKKKKVLSRLKCLFIVFMFFVLMYLLFIYKRRNSLYN